MSEMDSSPPSLRSPPPNPHMIVISPTSAGTCYNLVLNDSSHRLYRFPWEAIMLPSKDASHEGRISSGAVQHMGGSTPVSVVWLHELGKTERIGVSIWGPCKCLSLSCILKNPQAWPSVHGICRQGKNRFYIASSLCCDSPLPHSEGSNESPGCSLHLHPSLLMQCLIVPQSPSFPVKTSTWICMSRVWYFLCYRLFYCRVRRGPLRWLP